jgi:hypothetical protein
VTAKHPDTRRQVRINALPTTDAHRKRLHGKPVRGVNMLTPTVRHVTEIVPQNLIPKLCDEWPGLMEWV